MASVHPRTLGRFWARLGDLWGWSQRAIAQRAGVQPEALTRWKSGEHNVSMDAFSAMNNALSVPPDVAFLIGRYESLADDDPLLLELAYLVKSGRGSEVREALRAAGYR